MMEGSVAIQGKKYVIGKAIVRNAIGDCSQYNGRTDTYKISNKCAHKDCTKAIATAIQSLQRQLPVECKKYAGTNRGCVYGPGC